MIFCVALHTLDEHEYFTPILIGHTNSDLKNRINSIQYNNPYPVDLLGCWEGTSNDKAVVHELFKDFHIRGEWYKGVPELIEFINNSSQHSREYKRYIEGAA